MPSPPTAAKTATAAAMPNTPPSSRIVLLTPAAMPIAAGGTALTTEFCADGKHIDTPTPATTRGAIIGG